MKKFYVALSITLTLILSCSKHHENNELNAIDQAFITQVSISNKAEIETGQLAASRSDNASIRAFGQTMVTEYTQAQADLEKLAAMLNIELVTSMDANRQTMMTRLNGLNGFSLDTTYIRDQVRTHQRVLSICQSTFNEGNNSNVKGYVHRFVDIVEANYLKADSVARQL